MKHRIASVVLATVIISACGIGVLRAGDETNVPTPAVTAAIDLPVRSAYFWRGQVINDEAVVQPEINLELSNGFGFTTWLNNNLTDNLGERGEFDEADLTLYYTTEISPVAVTVGVTEYLYSNPQPQVWAYEGGEIYPPGVSDYYSPSTREVFLVVEPSESVEWLIKPSLEIDYDVDEVNGVYGVLGLTWEKEICKDLCGVSVNVGLGAASSDYNNYYFGVSQTALNDFTARLELPFTINETFALTPSLHYSLLVDNDIADAAEALYGHDEYVVGSLSLTAEF